MKLLISGILFLILAIVIPVMCYGELTIDMSNAYIYTMDDAFDDIEELQEEVFQLKGKVLYLDSKISGVDSFHTIGSRTLYKYIQELKARIDILEAGKQCENEGKEGHCE